MQLHKYSDILLQHMAQAKVIFFKNEKECPVLEWLETLPDKAKAKGRARIEGLTNMGYELPRPAADTLRDGVHELRWRLGRVQYRILYCFASHERNQAVLLLGFRKEDDKVENKDIELALKRINLYNTNPQQYTYI